MKLLKESKHVYLYTNKFNETLITFTTNDRLGVLCDSCGQSITSKSFVVPDPNKTNICDKCFKRYATNYEYLISNQQTVLNNTILISKSMKNTLDAFDIKLINDFFNEHSRRERLDITNWL